MIPSVSHQIFQVHLLIIHLYVTFAHLPLSENTKVNHIYRYNIKDQEIHILYILCPEAHVVWYGMRWLDRKLLFKK